MLKLYHYRGDLDRQQSLISEAMELERSAAAQSIRDADPRWAIKRDGPPVFVHAASFCLLFDSFAHSDQPASHVAAAKAAYATMLRRRDEAVAGGWHKRKLQLIISEAVTNAYLKFLQRAGLADEMLQLWTGMSVSDKEGNPQALVAVLNALSTAESGQLQAEQLMATEAPWNVQLVNAWLGCYERSGDWRGAEAVWLRMLERQVAPDSSAYRALMEVHMADGSAAQLAKIESLWAEMRGDSGPAGRPLTMAVKDYENLIKRAHHCGLSAEVLKWASRAEELSAWHQIDETSQRIAARCRRAEMRC
jgi:pentatricopeptide repeat protein